MLQLVEDTDDYTVAAHDMSVVCLVWKKNIDVKALDAVDRVAGIMYAFNGGQKLFMFTCTMSMVERPSEEAQVAISNWLRKADGIFTASAVMHYDSGVRGVFVKAITWAIAKASDFTIKHRPFFSYRSAVKFFDGEAPGRLDVERAQADIERLLQAVMEGTVER